MKKSLDKKLSGHFTKTFKNNSFEIKIKNN